MGMSWGMSWECDKGCINLKESEQGQDLCKELFGLGWFWLCEYVGRNPQRNLMPSESTTRPRKGLMPVHGNFTNEIQAETWRSASGELQRALSGSRDIGMFNRGVWQPAWHPFAKAPTKMSADEAARIAQETEEATVAMPHDDTRIQITEYKVVWVQKQIEIDCSTQILRQAIFGS